MIITDFFWDYVAGAENVGSDNEVLENNESSCRTGNWPFYCPAVFQLLNMVHVFSLLSCILVYSVCQVDHRQWIWMTFCPGAQNYKIYHSHNRESYNDNRSLAHTFPTWTAALLEHDQPDDPTPRYTVHRSQTSTCSVESLACIPMHRATNI